MQGIKKATPIKARREAAEDSDSEDGNQIFGAIQNDEEQSQAIESTTAAVETSVTTNEELPVSNHKLIKLHSDSEAFSNRGAGFITKPRTSEGNFTDEDDEEKKTPF
jgi:hypothetical protein